VEKYIAMLRAWVTALVIMLAAAGLWLGMRLLDVPSGIRNAMFWLSPIVAAFFLARIAPRRRILNSLLLAIPVAMMFALVNHLDEKLGRYRTFPGMEGAITVMVLTLPYSLGLCGLGAALGNALPRRSAS
jgi:hypothetical protein